MTHLLEKEHVNRDEGADECRERPADESRQDGGEDG